MTKYYSSYCTIGLENNRDITAARGIHDYEESKE